MVRFVFIRRAASSLVAIGNCSALWSDKGANADAASQARELKALLGIFILKD